MDPVTPLSPFHPAVASWFRDRLGEPTAPQRDGWPLIREGRNVADRRADRLGQDARRVPVGDRRACFRQGAALPDETQVALRLAAARARRTTSRRTCRARWPRSARSTRALPEVRVLVRTGDTPAARAHGDGASGRRTSWSRRRSRSTSCSRATAGARCCATVRTVIVDEIHALVARQARLAPRALARAARGAGRAAAPAHRPLGDAEAARRGRRASSSAPAASARSSTSGTSATLDLGDRGPALAARAPSARTSSGTRSTRASPS